MQQSDNNDFKEKYDFNSDYKTVNYKNCTCHFVIYYCLT